MDTIKGNLLNLVRGIMVFGCNCQGEMTGGFGKLVHDKWPDVRRAYTQVSDANLLRLGDIVAVAGTGVNQQAVFPHVVTYSTQIPEELIVVNAMTEFKCGTDPDKVYVDYDAVEACFTRVRMLARDSGLPVHFPLIGCGLAHGKWEEVAPRIQQGLGNNVPSTLWKFEG